MVSMTQRNWNVGKCLELRKLSVFERQVGLKETKEIGRAFFSRGIQRISSQNF